MPDQVFSGISCSRPTVCTLRHLFCDGHLLLERCGQGKRSWSVWRLVPLEGIIVVARSRFWMEAWRRRRRSNRNPAHLPLPLVGGFLFCFVGRLRAVEFASCVGSADFHGQVGCSWPAYSASIVAGTHRTLQAFEQTGENVRLQQHGGGSADA